MVDRAAGAGRRTRSSATEEDIHTMSQSGHQIEVANVWKVLPRSRCEASSSS